MPESSKEYWKTVLDQVESPMALNLIPQLDLDDVTGVMKEMIKSPPCFDYHTQVKKRFPDKIVLVQVGDFYETTGHDAVLMVSECGLNPMRPQAGTPRAGCPLVNIRKVLYQLVEGSQLSVVVCNEYDPAPGEKCRTLKKRKIFKIYNPGELGYHEELSHGMDSEQPSRNVALMWEPNSEFALLDFTLDQSCITAIQHLNEDAMWGQLSAKMVSAPICVHSSFSSRVPEWKKSLSRLLPNVRGRIKRLDDAMGPIEGFKEFLRLHHGLPQEQEFHIRKQDKWSFLRSPSLSTASQLGLIGTTSIPNILDFMVPEDSLVPVKAWYKDLLLVPKSLQTTACIHQFLHLASNVSESLPQLRTYVSPEKLTKGLQQESVGVLFFRTLHLLLDDVCSMFQTRQLRSMSQTILPIIEEEQNSLIDSEQFHQVCSQAQDSIAEIVILENSKEEGTLNGSTGMMSMDPTLDAVFQELFSRVEKFGGIVHERHISRELQELSEAKEYLISTVLELLEKLQSLNSDASSNVTRFELKIDRSSLSLYLTLSPSLLSHPKIESITLIPYFRPNGKPRTSKRLAFYTFSLQTAVDVYKATQEKINLKIKQLLDELKKELQSIDAYLTAACRFSLKTQSLLQHSWKAQESGWRLPDISRVLEQDEQSTDLTITDMWPYWMAKGADKTIRNSVTLKDMVLLTGPNMAGKSTVLRSILAVSLLALSGLYVPSEQMVCPYLDNVVLRSFSGDHPLDNQSGFSMEMFEMRKVMEQATRKSLVLLDELGKGTEVKTGSGLSGSFLEHFADLRCKGIFSTHLHLMKRMPLKLDGISFMKMKTRKIEMDDVDGNGYEATSLALEKHEPEWIISHGYNSKSLGIQVAQECGLPQDIIIQACQYEQKLLQTIQTDPQLDAAWPMVQESDTITIEPMPSTTTLPSTKEEEVANDEVVAKEDVVEEDEGMAKEVAKNEKVVEEDIGNLLQNICLKKGIDQNGDLIKVYYVREGQNPPPFTAKRSCVYVCRRSSGHHYVGETDNLKTRLKSHRSKALRAGVGKKFETWYICISKSEGAKSMSRAIETMMIQALTDKGYLMESVHDKRNRSFGIGK